MHNEKEYLTIDEQISLLKDKGLIIDNEKIARKYLKQVGYYKLINGYREPFMFKFKNKGIEQHKFVENTTISELFYLYNFDQDLKNLIFKHICQIEVFIKSLMSDLISRKYGVKQDDYLKQDNFKSDKETQKNFIEIQTDILNTIKLQNGKHKAITWYAENYGYYPFWVVANVLSLGTISLLYSKLKQPDQFEISNSFGLKSKIFESMLMTLLLFRNACAHNEVIYNFKTIRSLAQKEISFIYEKFNIPKDPKNGRYKFGTNDVFALIIIYKLLLDKSQFNEFISKFKSILNKLKKKVDEQMYNGILLSMGIVGDLEILKTI